MNIKWTLLAIFTILGQVVLAQWDGMSIDPEAKKILDNLKKEYDGYSSMEASFTLTLELPESPPEVQKGLIGQAGEKYFVRLADQEIYCDGKNVWLYQKDINEAQLNNADTDDENGGFLSPKDMLSIYDREEFIYAITDRKVQNNVPCTLIEFKPTDNNSEYTKLKLEVDEKRLKMQSLKIFSRDGSRYTLQIEKITPNVKFSPDVFSFNADNYPGVYIEDLRID